MNKLTWSPAAGRSRGSDVRLPDPYLKTTKQQPTFHGIVCCNMKGGKKLTEEVFLPIVLGDMLIPVLPRKL